MGFNACERGVIAGRADFAVPHETVLLRSYRRRFDRRSPCINSTIHRADCHSGDSRGISAAIWEVGAGAVLYQGHAPLSNRIRQLMGHTVFVGQGHVGQSMSASTTT